MVIHGRNVILMAGGVAIAAAKSCDLNVSANIIKTSSPSSGEWETAIAGRKSWRASCSGLLTSIIDGHAMVGTQVTLRMQLEGDYGLPFYGMVSGVTIEEGFATSIQTIFWDTTSKQFVAMKLDGTTPKYYAEWQAGNGWKDSSWYNVSPDEIYFKDSGGIVYKKITTTGGDNLVPEALQGTAIVQDWRVTAALGNLAQGSFQFQGVGQLKNPTT